MSLIDRTYFDGPIILDVVGNERAIASAIEQYEPEYLRGLFGSSLYVAFLSGLAAGNRSYFSAQFSDQFLKSPLDDRWRWIIEGATVSLGTESRYWPGLTPAAKRNSPLAYYVYWQYRRDNSSAVTGLGETQGRSENASFISPIPKVSGLWNRMLKWNEDLRVILERMRDGDGNLIYPEYVRNEICKDRTSRDLVGYQNPYGI